MVFGPVFQAEVDSEAVERILKKMQDRIKQPQDLITAAVMLVERNTKQITPVRRPDVVRETGIQGGTLRRSITHRLLSPTSGEVGTNVEYARFVHDGTRFMAARPFLVQGLDTSRPTIDRLVDRWGDGIVDG